MHGHHDVKIGMAFLARERYSPNARDVRYTANDEFIFLLGEAGHLRTNGLAPKRESSVKQGSGNLVYKSGEPICQFGALRCDSDFLQLLGSIRRRFG